jgi:hypothetical protein
MPIEDRKERSNPDPLPSCAAVRANDNYCHGRVKDSFTLPSGSLCAMENWRDEAALAKSGDFSIKTFLASAGG